MKPAPDITTRLRAALAEALAERDAARADLHQLVSDIGREAVLCDTVLTPAAARELDQIAERIEATIKQARGGQCNEQRRAD